MDVLKSINFSKLTSVKAKILMIAVAAVLAFGGYISFIFFVANENSHRLHNTRQVGYPVLQKAASNIVNVRNFGKTLEVAVSTADSALVDEAQAIAAEIYQGLEDIVFIDPSLDIDVQDARDLFEDYQNNAIGLASGLIDGTIDFSKIQEIIQKNNESGMPVSNIWNGLPKFKQTYLMTT